MDFDHKLNKIEREAHEIAREATELRKKHETAVSFTAEFLARCEAEGITRVAIGREHKSIPTSIGFPFGPSGSVFSFSPKRQREKHDRPPIWNVIEDMRIDDGCGNDDQHQADLSNLIDGVYHRRNGQWIRVD